MESKIEDFKVFERKISFTDFEDLEEAGFLQIKEKTTEMLRAIILLKKGNDKLKTEQSLPESVERRLEKIEKAIKSATENMRGGTEGIKKKSYADKLKAPAVEKEEKPRNDYKHVVAIYPNDDEKTADSEETKGVVFRTLVPSKEKLKILSVKKISNKGILVATKTQEDLARITRSEKLKAAGLKTEVPSKKKPLLIVFGVNKEMTDKEFLQSLRKQNLEKVHNAQNLEPAVISHRTGRRD
ncbi:hypothetical protein M0802_015152, partial [Mischocyttarus mexicanus]